MTLHRRLTDREAIGDLLIRVAGGDQSEDVDFAYGQRVISCVIGQLRGKFYRNSFLSCMDGTDCIEQFLVHVSFEYVPSSTAFEGP